MDYTNLIFGTLALTFGVYMLYLRVSGKIRTSEKLIKMKQLMGDTTGNIVHLVAYTILPLVVGLIMLVAAFSDSL